MIDQKMMMMMMLLMMISEYKVYRLLVDYNNKTKGNSYLPTYVYYNNFRD